MSKEFLQKLINIQNEALTGCIEEPTKEYKVRQLHNGAHTVCETSEVDPKIQIKKAGKYMVQGSFTINIDRKYNRTASYQCFHEFVEDHILTYKDINLVLIIEGDSKPLHECEILESHITIAYIGEIGHAF